MERHFTWLVLLASVVMPAKIALSQSLPEPRTQVTRESLSPVALSGERASRVLPRTAAFRIARERLDRRVATEGGASDYRWRGAMIGAIGLGVALGTFTYVMCGIEPSKSCAKDGVLVAVPSAAVGAGVGAMIGSAFPRDTIRAPAR